MAETKITNSVVETRELGALFAKSAKAGDVYALVGDLGCGKTEFARGFIGAVCNHADVRSPTFSIINIHQGIEFPVYHFDFYRIKKQDELVEIGYYDYIASQGVVLIEWANMFPEVLPKDVKEIRFEDAGDCKREISYSLLLF
jgi:tRNA threonylcarbamoyladenosine biosynthesis protein TsaE